MKNKIPRHIVGGVALTNGVLLHAPDVAVLSFRDENEEITTMYWKIPDDKKVPKWLHMFGVRGLWLLWRTIWWNSRVRTFVTEHTKNVLKSYGVDNGHKKAPSTSLFPFLGVVVAILIYLDLVWAVYLVGDFSRGWDEVTRSDLTVFLMTAALIIYIVWRGGIWEYMGYHGAEHQVIHSLDDGKMKNVHSRWPYQTRCGAAVVSYVAILLAAVGVFVTIDSFWWILLLALILFSLAYELVIFLDKHQDQYWAEFLSLPGIVLQFLVARPPRKDQSEVAEDAMRVLVEKSDILRKHYSSQIEDVPLI